MANSIDSCLTTCIVLFAHCSFIAAEWNTKDYLRRDHSLIKPYYDGRWDFQGSTIVMNNQVRLTSDHQSREGSIWNSVPCAVRDWELHVHFRIHGQSAELFGDGLALWYTKDRMKPGPVFGSSDYFKGLAIFLDTYSNHNGPHNHGHPYVSGMVSNGTLHYDHDLDGTHTELAGCESAFRGSKHDTFVAIRYEKNKLTVSTDILGKNAWHECFSVDGVRLPTGYYFGASAATGQLADNHDVISIKLYDLELEREKEDGDPSKIEPSADFFSPPRDHVDDKKGGFISGMLTGWKLLVIIILALIGATVCAVVGYIIFVGQSESSRKRFY